jgi:ubiquinone/menaquinone biosynthesis C-methylase UbiE
MRKVDTRQIDYTGYVPTYDALRFRGSRNAYLERIRTRGILEAVGRHAFDRRVLDVGCGTARGLLELGRAGFTNLTGVDFTAEMLRTGREKIQAELPAPGATLIRGDAFRLPFADGTFDLVISLNFLHMFRFDLQREIVAEMTRVCAPGGLVVVELESIHKGFFCTRYLEQFRVRARTKFNSVWEVRRMFSRTVFRDVRVLGTVLPKAYVLLEHWRRLGEFVESVSYVPPLNWMASRVVVAGRVRERLAP